MPLTSSLDHIRRAVGHRFDIERAIGQGGMGTVYLARDRQLDRPVALKVLPTEYTQQSDLRERFLRETRTAAAFSHPNIVPVFSIEDHGDVLAYAMGFVEGETLAELVARSGPMPVRDVVRMLQDIGYALAYAHGRSVVHRDIKPDNIMIERATGRALLMDFGISRSVHSAPVAAGTNTALTRVGEVVGTPEFMSPEQAAGDDLDGRSDLYSLGLTAWFALTGQSAMRGENTQKVLVKQLTEPVPPVSQWRPDVPMALCAIVEQCVAKEPASRFASAEALVEALDASTLRAVEVPLPVRLLAQELSQVSIVVGFVTLLMPLAYTVLAYSGAGDLDVVLPLVLVSAIVWGRVAQTVQQARRLFLRGFTVDSVLHGFRGLRIERDAERAQLKADPLVRTKRRRQQVVFVSTMVAALLLRHWVLATMRTELRPGWYAVSAPGVIILYSVYVMAGVSIVGLLRSPLRPSIGERLFGWVWAGWPGRMLLSLLAGTRGTVDASSPRAVAPAQVATGLEQRVAALEAWRREVSGSGSG